MPDSTLPSGDALTMIANEFGRVRREVQLDFGVRNSVCAARRCLQALHVGRDKQALEYAELARKRSAKFEQFEKMVRTYLAAKKTAT